MLVLTCIKVSKDFFVGCLFLRKNFQTVGLTHSSAVIFRAILFIFEATSIKLIRFLCQSLKNKFCWGVIWQQYCYALEWLVEGKPWSRIWLVCFLVICAQKRRLWIDVVPIWKKAHSHVNVLFCAGCICTLSSSKKAHSQQNK